jgi:hypothetical protein
MSKQDAATAHMVSNAKRAATFGLIAFALTGCIIVVPPPARNDPFQAPSATAITIAKGNTHRMRLDCGAQQVFRSTLAPVEGLVIDYNAENLVPVKQNASAPIRLTWKGPAGAAFDIPFNVGSGNTRTAMGSVTMNGSAGNHEFVVAMPSGPDCSPVKFKVAFR